MRFDTLWAMKRHSPAASLGHSGVGSTQEAAIQFAMLNVASSAKEVVRVQSGTPHAFGRLEPNRAVGLDSKWSARGLCLAFYHNVEFGKLAHRAP
jgi:hypothetical protein